jgi:outer membrane lipoprotein-sorting protein
MANSRRLGLWCVLLLWAGMAQAGDWSLQALMAQLAAVESRQVDYSEVRHLNLLGVPLQSRGELLYRAPDYLKKTVTEGGQGSYEIRGEQLRIEENGEVQELPLSAHPPLQAFVASFRATLAGDLTTLQRYYRLSLSGSAAAWTLTLVPTEPSMAAVIREVTIHGSGDTLQQVETLETGGDSSMMTMRGEDG